MTGNLVSLYHAHPSHANTCHCRVDTNTDTSTNDTTNIQMTAYDIQASVGSVWSVEVTDPGGAAVLSYSGVARQFPAESLPTLSASSLSVAFALDDPVSGLQRVWLGFQGVWLGFQSVWLSQDSKLSGSG